MHPHFSIIIPALNEEGLLPACLASLPSVDAEGGVEVLVVDNGSTDGTAFVARVGGAAVVPCEERGVVHARQAGLVAAHGDIVVHLDADSRLAVSTLSTLAKHFADPHVAAVVGNVDYIPGTMATRLMQGVYISANALLRFLTGRPRFALAGALAFRRDMFLRAGGYEVGLPHSGDEAGILRRLARHGKIVWEPRFVVSSSDRRFRGRFAKWLASDLFLHTFVDQLTYRVTHRSKWGDRPALR